MVCVFEKIGLQKMRPFLICMDKILAKFKGGRIIDKNNRPKPETSFFNGMTHKIPFNSDKLLIIKITSPNKITKPEIHIFKKLSWPRINVERIYHHTINDRVDQLNFPHEGKKGSFLGINFRFDFVLGINGRVKAYLRKLGLQGRKKRGSPP